MKNLEIIFSLTYATQVEILPRFTVIYGKNIADSDIERNGFAFEWLWWSVFVQVGNRVDKSAPCDIITLPTGLTACMTCNKDSARLFDFKCPYRDEKSGSTSTHQIR